MSSLWAYSGDVYGRTGVAAACLALQHGYGLDVNILLYCCWAGRAGIELGTPGVTAAVELCKPWSTQTVGRLRAARTWMKTANAVGARVAASDYGELREAIKALELEAERLQQEALASLIAGRAEFDLDPAARLGCMAANVRAYLDASTVRIDADVSDHLGVLLGATSSMPASAVQAALGQTVPAGRAR